MSTRGWRDYEFNFGSVARKRLETALGAGADNLPGHTPATGPGGKIRALDFDHFDEVDFTLNDEAEDYS